MMTRIADPNYLKEQQYKTPDNLQARVNLHKRFGTNPYDWQLWVYDQLVIRPGMCILEAGCGPGGLWHENAGRLASDVQVMAGDYSIGMVKQAIQVVQGREQFSFLNLDVQHLPFSDDAFNGAIANHMLYHVPDIALAASELRRILKPGGWLCAATNGLHHMRELHELIGLFSPGYLGHMSQVRRYSLENALELLGQAFEQVEVRRFDENLVVTEAEPLIAYIYSMWDLTEGLGQEKAQEMESYIHGRFAEQGEFRISKSQGVVLARKG